MKKTKSYKLAIKTASCAAVRAFPWYSGVPLCHNRRDFLERGLQDTDVSDEFAHLLRVSRLVLWSLPLPFVVYSHMHWQVKRTTCPP